MFLWLIFSPFSDKISHMTKYKVYFDKMVSENKDAFNKFTKAHFEYSIDQEKNQEEFNKIGAEILNIIHEWEDRLCKQSENAGFGSYTSNLAEKFQTEIKSHFPLIDHVGIVVNEAPQPYGRGIFSPASSGVESLRSENTSLTHELTPGIFAKGDKFSIKKIKLH